MSNPEILDRTALASRLGIEPDSVARMCRAGLIPPADASTTATPGVGTHRRYHAEVVVSGPDGQRTVRCDHDHQTERTAAACARGIAARVSREAWHRATIDAWEPTRPGRGAGAGRPRKIQESRT